MDIGIPNFRPLREQESNPLAGLVDAFLNARSAAQSQKQQDLSNKKSMALLPFVAPEASADLDYKKAQTQREQALADAPFGGHTLPGVAGQIMALENIKKLYGENSSQYQQAKHAMDFQEQKQRALMSYQQALTNTLPTRNLSPTGKSYVEESRVNSGLAPSGQSWDELVNNVSGKIDRNGKFINSPTPASASSMAGTYDLVRQKGATDPDTRKRNLFATNIEKTLDRINSDDLTRYSGPHGSAMKGVESIRSLAGKQSKNYDNYKKSLEDVGFLVAQARQFYGDSVQPEAIKKLETLLNPQSWQLNPELSKKIFDEGTNVLRSELQTYRDALKNPGVYQGKESNARSIPTAPTKTQGTSAKKLKWNPKTDNFEVM